MRSRDDYETSVDCPRCGNDCIEAYFEDRAGVWSFGYCDCGPRWTDAERAELVKRGETNMEKAYDRAHP